jgi:hypothetical protein
MILFLIAVFCLVWFYVKPTLRGPLATFQLYIGEGRPQVLLSALFLTQAGTCEYHMDTNVYETYIEMINFKRLKEHGFKI